MFSSAPPAFTHILRSHHYAHKLKSATLSLSSPKTKNKKKKKKGNTEKDLEVGPLSDDDEEKGTRKTQGLK